MRIKNTEIVTNHGNVEGRKVVAALLDAGLDSLDPYYRVKEFVKLRDNLIILDNRAFEMKGDPHSGAAVYDLSVYRRVFVIGAAKGVQRAALALEEILGNVLTAGHVIAKHGEEIICRKIGVTLAGHPVPDSDCLEGCEKIERLISNLTEHDLVFTIFGSGCGSLLTYPAGEISIADISGFTRMMQIEKGVPTSELNKIRTHIDRFKGGRLLRKMQPAAVVNLVTADPSKMNTPVLRVSYYDMLKNNTFFPTTAAASSFDDCVSVLHKWDAWNKTPASIKHCLTDNRQDENMSIGEYERYNCRFFGLIFKDTAVYPAVRKKAAEIGMKCVMLSEYMQAEAREAGFVDSGIALTSARLGEPFEAPVILMSSGENIVTVGTQTGVGGRNQEYCIAAALNIAGDRKIVFGAVDTDGTDGPGGLQIQGAPECLAGAIVDGFTAEEAEKAGINLLDALKTHSTSVSMWKLDCGVDATSGISALDLRIIYIMN